MLSVGREFWAIISIMALETGWDRNQFEGGVKTDAAEIYCGGGSSDSIKPTVAQYGLKGVGKRRRAVQ